LDEDGGHLFLRCKDVKSVWRDLKLEKEREDLCLCPDAKSVIHLILNLGDDKSTLIVCLLWQWWTRRNKINAKENTGNAEQLVSQVRYWAEECAEYYKKKQAGNRRISDVQWQAPKGDVLKINVDGAFCADTKSGGWGFVVRDQSGCVRGSWAGALHHVSSAAQSEILACEEATKAAAGWGMTSIIVESDSLNLVRAMSSTDFDRAYEGVVYRDLRLYMNLTFNSFEFSHVPRTCNSLAHNLAAYGATRQDIRFLWPESLPNDVRVLVASTSAEPCS
jgi:ribonuclease HI